MTTFSAASSLSTGRDAQSGIRPFDIGRDLRPVANLIGEAFASELDPRGSAALREMHAMSHVGGLLKVLNRSTGEFSNVFGGFVWVEQNETGSSVVVGNVTVQRGDSYGNRWQIANVAVAPEFRGRGIGRRLVQRALGYIQDHGGNHAVLQVEAGNAVARRLYEGLGFETLGGRTEMSITRIPKAERLNALFDAVPTQAVVRPFFASQWQRLYDLATSQQGDRARWWRPLRRVDFQVTFEQRMSELFWQVLGRRNVWRRRIGSTNRFEAATVLTAYRWRGVHEIQLWVRPSGQGELEEPLVQWIMAKLEGYPRWPVVVKLDTEHKTAIRVFERFGFEEQHTLLTMRREL